MTTGVFKERGDSSKLVLGLVESHISPEVFSRLGYTLPFRGLHKVTCWDPLRAVRSFTQLRWRRELSSIYEPADGVGREVVGDQCYMVFCPDIASPAHGLFVLSAYDEVATVFEHVWWIERVADSLEDSAVETVDWCRGWRVIY